jgi:crotonobetainyl-CoA:carnitine CoA-transferase CaiB-like acyl-CoA transferase
MTDSSGTAENDRERPGPLAGIKIVDLTHWAAGPVAAMVLGDLGADVLKIEPPAGEPQRGMGVTFPGGWSTFFLACQRNKRFVSINYRDPRGRELVQKMASTADVVLENARPGTWERHGLDYETLRKLNPGLIYASITGFGQTGPMRDWLAMDPIAQAAGGVVGITGSAGGRPSQSRRRHHRRRVGPTGGLRCCHSALRPDAHRRGPACRRVAVLDCGQFVDHA